MTHSQILPPLACPKSKAVPLFSVSVKNSAGELINCSDPKAQRALIALMDFHALLGGAASHWGGPSAFAEIISSIFSLMFMKQTNQNPWHNAFHFVNDAGHCENGIYAIRANYNVGDLTFEDLKQFRSIQSPLTGHGEVSENPEHVYISNGPLGSSIGVAQGLAMADKHKGDYPKRTTICTISDGALMEGEAKEALCAIPGFARKKLLNPFVCVLSDNGTKLSGRIDKDSYSLRPYIQSLETQGWHVIAIPNGNSLQDVYLAMELALEKANNNPEQPVLVWAHTTKGIGNQSCVLSESGGHGFPLKAKKEDLLQFLQELYGVSVPSFFLDWANSIVIPQMPNSPSAVKIQQGVQEALIAAKKKNIPVVSISSDLASSTGVKGFQKEFPNETFDAGVAESNMISIACGFSKLGYIPVVDTFAQFGVSKGYLPILMANLSKAPIVAIFSHTGFQDAADGASHQSTQYISALCGLPNTIVVNLSCSNGAKEYVYQGLEYQYQLKQQGKTPESIIYFLGRENFPLDYNAQSPFEFGKNLLLRKGMADNAPFLIVCSGSTTPLALTIWEELEKNNKAPYVIEMPFIHPNYCELVAQYLPQCKNKMIVLEDHQIVGGLGSVVTQGLHQLKINNIEIEYFGVSGVFGKSAYSAQELYDMVGLNKTKILQKMGLTEQYK